MRVDRQDPGYDTFREGNSSLLIQAFDQEMRRTKWNQKWPCGSLVSPLAPISHQILPNCSAPFVGCFVKFDTDPNEHVD